MKALVHVLVALVLLALQAALLRWVGGGAFSLTVAACCVVRIGLCEGNVEGAVAAAGIGYVTDLMTGSTKGLHTFLCVLLFVTVRAVAAAVDVKGRAPFALLSTLGALVLSLGAANLVHYTALPGVAPVAPLVPRMLVEALATAAISPFVLSLLRWIDSFFERQEPGLLR